MNEDRMRAVHCTRYGRPEVLKINEVKKPIPKSNEVLIKVYASSVSISDCIVRSGKVHPLLWLPMRLYVGFKKPRNPILGLELSGVIEDIGSEIKRFKKGDQIMAFTGQHFGGYAEYVCLPENGLYIPSNIIAIKPSSVSWEEAAVIPSRSTLAMHYLKKVDIQKDQDILIFGASGGVGSFAIQIAKYFGAKVTGICSTANVELVKSLGADKVIDYKKEDFTRINKYYDIIFDAAGKRYSKLYKLKRILKPNGDFISVDDGNPKIHIDTLLFIKELIEADKIKIILGKTFQLEEIVESHK